MPQWAGSCWYYLRYLDPANSQRLVDPAVERYWMVPPDAAPGEGGVDLYVGGVEHAVLHLLYARFWHKVLYDLGYLSTREPFRRLVNQGYILADAYLDERGMYVPAAEVVTAPDGPPRYQGQPVISRAGKMGKSLRTASAPMTSTPPTAPTHCACTRWPWAHWTQTGPGEPTTSPASTGSCSDCGAPSSTRTPARCGCTISHSTTRPFACCTARSRSCGRDLQDSAVQHHDRPPDGAQLPRGPASRGSRWPSARAGRAAGPRWPRSPRTSPKNSGPGWAPHVTGVLRHSPSSTSRWQPSRWSRSPVQIDGKTRFRMEVLAGAGEEEIARGNGQPPRIPPSHRGCKGQPDSDRPWPDRQHRDPAIGSLRGLPKSLADPGRAASTSTSSSLGPTGESPWFTPHAPWWSWTSCAVPKCTFVVPSAPAERYRADEAVPPLWCGTPIVSRPPSNGSVVVRQARD